MTQEFKLSAAGLKLVRFLVDQPTIGRSGAEISRATKVTSGTLYPLLAKLESIGWLKSEWENVEPSEAGRPRRRYYKLTALGQTNALKELSDVQLSRGVLAWN
jgi:PadR family transcriptional regulator PadR